MCEDCGCDELTAPESHDHHGDHVHKDHHHHEHGIDHDHDRHHPHGDHTHSHHSHEDHPEKTMSTVSINRDVMEKNNRYAAENRERFIKRGIYTVNLISSPGSGKTLLLESIARIFGRKMAVIEGDIQTHRDAERVIRAGSHAYQIETHGACHLDARSVGIAAEQLDLDNGCEFLVIENVGNLVCPATYDLGEHLKIAILSLPEGDDKVLKYPAIFSRIGALVFNKADLAPYLEFSTDKAANECRSLNRSFETFSVSAKTGQGVEAFCEFLRRKRAEAFTK